MSANPSVLAHHFEDLEQQHEAAALGMWAFLATEVLVFGALFIGYASYRALYPDAFARASAHLNVWIAGSNTIILLASSLTMALAVYGAQVGRRGLLTACLVLTALLGTAFMVLKAVEYSLDYRDHLVPGLAFRTEAWEQPQQVQLFLLFYYIMTGLHALHLTIGIAVVAVVAVLAWLGRFTAQYYSPVEVTGLYWHFVDVIWIFLLPLLYLIGSHTQL